jgi:hypothetical protein
MTSHLVHIVCFETPRYIISLAALNQDSGDLVVDHFSGLYHTADVLLSRVVLDKGVENLVMIRDRCYIAVLRSLLFFGSSCNLVVRIWPRMV